MSPAAKPRQSAARRQQTGAVIQTSNTTRVSQVEESMKKLVISVCAGAMAIAGAAAFAQEGAVLSGQDLKKAIAGRTVYLSSPLGEVPIRYSANGTMSARSQLALLDGERTASDRGRWWVASNRLCLKWQNWMNGRSYCFTMQKVGNRVHWRRNDGKSGVARIGS